MSTALATLA
ncbi:host-nuclease inhibitor protein Gam, partial [Escherichia coli 0.1288]